MALLRDIGEHDLGEGKTLSREGSSIDLETEGSIARAQRARMPPPLGRGTLVQVHVLGQAQHHSAGGDGLEQ